MSRLVLSLAHDAISHASGEAFLDSLDAIRPSCVIADLHMPGLTGLDVLKALRERGLAVPVIVVTGFDQIGMREKCVDAGVSAYLTKPLGRADVEAAINAAITPKNLGNQ